MRQAGRSALLPLQAEKTRISPAPFSSVGEEQSPAQMLETGAQDRFPFLTNETSISRRIYSKSTRNYVRRYAGKTYYQIRWSLYLTVPIIDPSQLEGIEHPELIFGFVAPVGTPLTHLTTVLITELTHFGYQAEEIHLSHFLANFNLPTPEAPPGASAFTRINALMTRGDELRENLGGGEALALLAAIEIQSRRPLTEPAALSGKAFVLNQLKHPDEVVWLRRIYGDAFHLAGVYCDEETRKHEFYTHRNMTEREAVQLIERDKGEQIKHGQQVTETFQHADLFVNIKNSSPADTANVKAEINRYLRLLFGHKTITPTREEYGMFLAQGAAYRSADLSRQVGAAILTQKSEVISLGANEVPAPGGGQYGASDEAKRDFEIGQDENTRIKFENLKEVLAVLIPDWSKKLDEEKEHLLVEATKNLKHTRMMNLTEFSRAVHAEMDALLSAGRIGAPVFGHELYCTTFPCHNCAKHIITAGIKRVLYIEPYPKSLAERLHGDAIVLGEPDETDSRVAFQAFCGVAPRMYPALFSSTNSIGTRIERKNSQGNIDTTPAGLRAYASPLTYIQREATIAIRFQQILKNTNIIKGAENHGNIEE